jgi:hypothetical protein
MFNNGFSKVVPFMRWGNMEKCETGRQTTDDNIMLPTEDDTCMPED